jgi:FkbM family methyltransferase
MLRNLGAKRFSLLQILLVSIVIVGVTVWGTRQAARTDARPDGPQVEPEAEPLKAKYGPAKHSYGPEEWIIRDFFQDKRGGFFLDVGANDYKVTSNTFYLEDKLQWSGIAIEPQKEFEAGYLKFRPRTKFFPFFVADVSNQQAKMYVLDKNSQIASGARGFTEQQGKKAQEVEVTTITLNDLLDSEKVQRIDFMSMDIETWEPKALAGFDIDRFKPQLVCIEVHDEVRQQIIDYFARHRYVVVGKYLRADPVNLYYTPMS